MSQREVVQLVGHFLCHRDQDSREDGGVGDQSWAGPNRALDRLWAGPQPSYPLCSIERPFCQPSSTLGTEAMALGCKLRGPG